VRADARLLILGSMPGAASLAARQYYAHPRNQFWIIIERLCDLPRSRPYHRRLLGLQRRHLALWDVLASCRRRGSLDASIEPDSAVPSDLMRLLRLHPGIVRLCCNGATAWRALQRYFGEPLRREFPHLECLRLPSSSPAYAGMPLERKIAHWRRALRGV
jgi:hypoxanthine-DNA glycosylase